MQIDLFTLVAQIVNFIILLILLRIFLYKPVVNAMNEREEKIAARLQEAEEKRQQAEQEAQKYQQKRAEINEERDRVLAEAREQAEARRKELFSDLRADVDEQREQWHRAIQQEKERFLRELQERTETQVIDVVRRTLDELADAELEAQMIQRFTREVDTHSDKIADAMDSDQREVVVHSAFELSDEQRERISSALNKHLNGVDVNFDRDAELVCGLRLETGTYHIGWNVKQYLDALEKRLRETLDDEMQSDEHDLEVA